METPKSEAIKINFTDLVDYLGMLNKVIWCVQETGDVILVNTADCIDKFIELLRGVFKDKIYTDFDLEDFAGRSGGMPDCSTMTLKNGRQITVVATTEHTDPEEDLEAKRKSRAFRYAITVASERPTTKVFLFFPANTDWIRETCPVRLKAGKDDAMGLSSIVLVNGIEAFYVIPKTHLVR